MDKKYSISAVADEYCYLNFDYCSRNIDDKVILFMKAKDLEDKIHVDRNIFNVLIFDVLRSIKLADDDENIFTDEKEIVFRSYVAYWWVRRKPFQSVKGADKSVMWINEEFALTLLLQSLPNVIPKC